MVNVNVNQQQESLRRIIREEVRPIVRQEVDAAIEDKMPAIIQRETTDMSNSLFAQAARVHDIETDVRHIKSATRANSNGIYRIDALLEDINNRLAGIQEQEAQ